MDFNKLFQSKKFKMALFILGALVILLLTFKAGMFVGYKKAGFSRLWGDNYYRTFGGHKERSKMDFSLRERDFSNAHGAAGKIIKIELPEFMLADRDGVEKIIVIKDTTEIRRFRETIKPTDLKIDDFAVAIGSPNDKAEIEAKFIRLLPAPLPDFMMGTGTPYRMMK